MCRKILCFLLAVIMGLTVLTLSSCKDSAVDTAINETDVGDENSEGGTRNTVTQKFGSVGMERKDDPSSSASTSTPMPSSGAEDTASITASSANNQISAATESTHANSENVSPEYIIESADSAEDQGQSEYRQGSSSAIDGEGASTDASSNTCAFVIDCSNAIKNDKLSSSLKAALPDNGIIYSSSSVEFSDGETVFDILYRITRDNGIPMEFSSSPLYGSKYIEGINSLFEFDCGELSGWEYKVNGVFPNYGCDLYTVHAGDNIGFYYTTNLGEDLK